MGRKKSETMNPVNKNWRTTKGQRAWYYAGRVGATNLHMLIPNLMNVFLIFNGVDLASVAFITLLVKVIDALDDMVFGFIVDKIDLKKIKLFKKLGGEGRYLPWLRCFMYLFPFMVFLFFLMPSSLSSPMKLVWFGVTYLLYDLTFTLVDVPMQSTLQTISDIPEERNHLTTWGYLLVMGSVYLVIILQQVLISESVGFSIRNVALVFGVIFAVLMLPLPFKIKEVSETLHNVETEQNEKYTFSDMFRALRMNRPYFLNFIAYNLPKLFATGSAVSVFVSYYLYGSSTAMVIPGVIGTVTMILIQAVAPKISKKFGNKKPLIVCTLICVLSSFASYFAGYNNFTFIAVMSVVNVGTSGLVTMLHAYMTLQAIEYGKYKAGRDTTGIFNAINTFSSKVTESVAASVGMFLLALFGWTTVNAESFADLAAQGIQQSATALNGLWIINALIPAIGALLGFIVLLFYGLDDEDARLMSLCNSGEISRSECEARLSKKY